MYVWTDGTDYLAHHGIKGQKWGVRRFRNLDGTLTEEGKKRYYADYGNNTLNKRGERLYKKDSKFRKEVLDRQEQLNLLRQKQEEQKAAAIKELDKNESIQKSEFLSADAGGFDSKMYRTDPKYRQLIDDTADLGLKALKQFKTDSLMQDDPWYLEQGYSLEDLRKSDREWFLWEDQTIGYPQIAGLINSGVPAKEVKRLIKLAKEAGSPYSDAEYETPTGRFRWYVSNGFGLEAFADECERVKKNK